MSLEWKFREQKYQKRLSFIIFTLFNYWNSKLMFYLIIVYLK